MNLKALMRAGFLLSLLTAGCQAAPAVTPAVHDHSTHSHATRESFTEVAIDPAATAGVSFREQVVPVLLRHCASCHTAGGTGTVPLAMFDERGEANHALIRGSFGRMLLEIQAGRMPQGKPYALSAQEFKTLDQWGATEMPDN